MVTKKEWGIVKGSIHQDYVTIVNISAQRKPELKGDCNTLLSTEGLLDHKTSLDD